MKIIAKLEGNIEKELKNDTILGEKIVFGGGLRSVFYGYIPFENQENVQIYV